MITGMAAGILLAAALEGIWQMAPAMRFAGDCTGTAWASGGQWEYNDAGNLWYYLDEKGEKVKGKKELNGDVYFFGEDGAMLTGWVHCPKNEFPEPYSEAVEEGDIYYCGQDGKMATGWVTAYNPEQAVYDDRQQFEGTQEDEYEMKRYYFEENGKPCRDRRKTIDGKRYLFDEEGAVLTGWIYDRGDGSPEQYLRVDTDSQESDKELCRDNPENMMYATEGDGSLAANQWVDAIPPWDDEDDDSRSFYADSSSYIVTGRGGRGNGTSVSARRKAQKVDEIGTYILEGWSTDVNVTRIDGKYYCLEDSGTRTDGMIFLSGAEGDPSFGDGLYCFMDNAAMKTGPVMKENVDDDDGSDGYVYYYYFSERSNSKYSKGQGISGVSAGRLYYQGLAVGAQFDTCEVVYLPTLEEKDDTGKSTGFFLVDGSGRVKKGTRGGSHYVSSDGNEYRVTKISDKNDEYGYVIDYYDGEKDDDNRRVWKSLTEKDYDYICWDTVEE